ncbi:helix-turn-helix domain-containing protein [Flavobacterium oncorhynchi]|uniref:helix-turn-helix domain-containing protein n=1 Tax=Flavobacterium oncorhynchi TaxID=728056 RepID=UPI00351A8DFE
MLLNLNKVERHANRLLAYGLLNISLVLTLNGLTYVDGFYLSYPHSYRLGIFSQYLLAPFFYLYVRATLGRESKFEKWDWLHFVPAVFHFIEFIPFYIMPTQEKVTYLKYAFSHVEILSQQKEGLLPPSLHPLLKMATGIVYEFFQARLLFLFYKKNRKWQETNRVVWNWLVRLTFFHSLTYIFVFVSFIVFFNRIDMRIFSILALGIIQFFCTITLLFNPRVLYGMKEYMAIDLLPDSKDSLEEENLKKYSISLDKREMYKNAIEVFVGAERPYLKKKYTIREFAADCNVPVHYLSIVINLDYGCNYNDFINGLRVKFIIDQRYNEDWDSFSLEGIASEAGFNSRNAFYIAFKKVTGETPSIYFAKNSEKDLKSAE